MDLLDRYLQAVKFWLPRDQKTDIIAELSEDLRSQIEEQESGLGRSLSVNEIEPILKRCGSPMAVAGRYLPQRSLIGPSLFPIYRVIIRSLVFYFLLPWLALWLGITIFSPDFRADHPGAGLLSTLEPWWLACTYSLFFCTIAFALLDRSQARSHLLNDWNPRSLPPVRDRNRIPRLNTIIELTVSVAALTLWVQLDPFRRVFHMFGVTIIWSQPWPYLIWGLTILSGAGIALACLNLANPRWTRLSATLRLGIDCYSWGLVYWLCRANLLQSLSGHDVTAHDPAKLVASINFWMGKSAVWVIAIGLIVLAFDIGRILRVGDPS
jgi:branched-subunit amino acid transport protein